MEIVEVPEIIPAVHWPMIPIIVLMNISVMVAILKNTKLHIPANYFVFAMAFFNLLTGGVEMPVLLTNSTKTFIILHALKLFVSLGLNCACTYDRFSAIVSALRYNEEVAKMKALVMIGIICTLSFLVAVFPSVWLNNLDERVNIRVLSVHRVYIALTSGIFVAVTGLQMLMYAIILIVARKYASQLEVSRKTELLKKEFGDNRVNRHADLVANVKLTKCFILVSLSVFIFWLPAGYVNYMDYLTDPPLSASSMVRRVSLYSEFVPCMIHPLLYAMYQKNMRDAIMFMCKK